MKLIKGDTRKDFKDQGIATSLSLFPAIIYQRWEGGRRTISFLWLWLTLTVRLPDHIEYLKFKLVVAK